MSNQGKFLIFAGAIILLAMLAGGSNTRSTLAPAKSPPSCLDPDYPNDPNCIWSDDTKSAIESFRRGLTISENRARTGKWIDAPK